MMRLFITLLLAVNYSGQFICRHIAGVEIIPFFDVSTTFPIILMLLPGVFKKGYAAIRKKFEFVIVLSLIPYLLAYAYTFFLIALMYAQSNTINLYQAARFPIKAVYYIVLAGILLLRFREQALEMFCEAVIMSYAVNIMYGFAKIGVGGVLQYLATMAYVSARASTRTSRCTTWG